MHRVVRLIRNNLLQTGLQETQSTKQFRGHSVGQENIWPKHAGNKRERHLTFFGFTGGAGFSGGGAGFTGGGVGFSCGGAGLPGGGVGLPGGGAGLPGARTGSAKKFSCAAT